LLKNTAKTDAFKINVFYLNVFLKCIYSCDVKAAFSAINNITILKFWRNISYCQCCKTYCKHTIFGGNHDKKI